MNNYGKVKEIKRNLTDLFRVEKKEIKAKLINIEHHRAHVTSGFFVSSFSEARWSSAEVEELLQIPEKNANKIKAKCFGNPILREEMDEKRSL